MGIEVTGVYKRFGEPPTTVLHDINFKVRNGEFVSISGRSGSGKTTLLYLISTLDRPSEGRILVDEIDPYEMSVADLHILRNRKVGFIFQFHYLLPELTALENILLPARKAGLQLEKQKLARDFLEEFGIPEKADRFPSQLSGGEQQRVAIARSLIMHPEYIFADEPTGNLDTANGLVVMETLKRVNRELKTTICLVTHEPDYAAMASRQIHLVDGRVSPPHS